MITRKRERLALRSTPPRRYRRRARKDYLAFAKSRKHTKKQIRSVIGKQLSYVRRDIGYLEGYFSQGCVLDTKDIPLILIIFKLYEQQEYIIKLYDKNAKCSHYIISI